MNLSLADETSEITIETVATLKKIREAVDGNITGCMNVSIFISDLMSPSYHTEPKPTESPLSNQDWQDVFFLADKDKDFRNLLSLLKTSDDTEFSIDDDKWLARAISLCWRLNYGLSRAELNFVLFIVVSKKRGRKSVIKLKLCRLS